MGAFLDKPKTDKHNESGEGNGLRYGLSSMQGWRVEMEDAHCAVTGLSGNLKDWSFFAVFDGHAGARASTYCATQLLDAIVGTDDFRKVDADTAPSLEEVKKGLREGFLGLDVQLRATSEVRNGEDKSGSTAITVLLSPTAVVFANCGDSRGMLIRNAKVEFATEDHKPGNPNERERIINAGGSVIIQRVNGSLAVSRALGDFEYKNVAGKGQCEQLVSPEPEITIVPRCPEDDQLIVLACDGVWDVMTNEELCAFLLNRMRISDNLTEICNQAIDTCLYKGSRDNMSIVVIALPNAPKPDADCIAKEKQLDEEIERRVRDMFEACEDLAEIDLSRVLHRLGTELDSQLPPGGGLAAKRLLVEEVYSRLYEEYSKKLKKSGGSSTAAMASAAARRTATMGATRTAYGHVLYSQEGERVMFGPPFGMDLDPDEHFAPPVDSDPLVNDSAREPSADPTSTLPAAAPESPPARYAAGTVNGQPAVADAPLPDCTGDKLGSAPLPPAEVDTNSSAQ